MKFSEETMSILKNFSAINNGIYFEQGNVVKTVSPKKSILAEAKTEDSVPVEFGIYDLNKFLVLSHYLIHQNFLLNLIILS